MIKIWRNRIWAGTQKLANCPDRYKSDVIEMMKQDLNDKIYRIETLKNLVREEKLTKDEYKIISGEDYTE